MQIERNSIKKILVLRNDRFGEFLLNIPALRALKETFINAEIIVIVNPYVKELVQSLPYIDESIEWKQGKHSLFEKIRMLKMLKQGHFDIAIMLNPSKEFNIFSYLAGIPIRLGYARKWHLLLTHKMEDKKYLAAMHEVEYNLELVGLIGAKTEDKMLSLPVEDSIADALFKECAINDFKNLIALHPFTSDPIKQWPLENFLGLAKKLISDSNITVLIIGGKDELFKSREFFGDFRQDNLVNMTGKTTLKQLAAILKRCKLLISGDSGPVHLATCVGTPVIAVFRSDIPAKSAHRWGPWGKGNIIIQKDNLSDISVNEVIDACKKISYH